MSRKLIQPVKLVKTSSSDRRWTYIWRSGRADLGVCLQAQALGNGDEPVPSGVESIDGVRQDLTDGRFYSGSIDAHMFGRIWTHHKSHG